MFKLLFLLAGTSLVRKLSVCSMLCAKKIGMKPNNVFIVSLTSNHHKIAGKHLFYNIIISDAQRIYTNSQKIRIISKTSNLEGFHKLWKT